MSKKTQKLSTPKSKAAGSLDAVVRRAIAKYQIASRKYNSDCNQRLIKAPDAKRKLLALKSCRAFSAMLNLINKSTPNTKPSGGHSPSVSAEC